MRLTKEGKIKIGKKEKEFFDKFQDFDLMCMFTDHEIRYLKIALHSLIHIKKAGVPISVYVNPQVYEVAALTYLRIGGDPTTISSYIPFKNVMENAIKKMKRQANLEKELEEIEKKQLTLDF